MQISASLNLVPVELTHKRNIVSKKIAVIFVNDTLYGPEHLNLEPIKYDNGIIRGEQFTDFFTNDLHFETTVTKKPTVQVIEKTFK